MKTFLITILSIIINSTLFCQTDSIPTNNNIKVMKDPRIDELVKRHEKSPLKGFRVQIYSDNKKQPARQIRAKFKNTYKDIEAYEEWQQPYYKVKVGDFKTKLEALKFQKQIMSQFPNSFIVKDNINYQIENRE